jgi:hypothetical protein
MCNAFPICVSLRTRARGATRMGISKSDTRVRFAYARAREELPYLREALVPFLGDRVQFGFRGVGVDRLDTLVGVTGHL